MLLHSRDGCGGRKPNLLRRQSNMSDVQGVRQCKRSMLGKCEVLEKSQVHFS